MANPQIHTRILRERRNKLVDALSLEWSTCSEISARAGLTRANASFVPILVDKGFAEVKMIKSGSESIALYRRRVRNGPI